MAQITWRNVDAPNFGDSNDLLRTSALAFNKGMDSAIGTLDTFQKDRTAEESNRLRMDVLKHTDPESLKRALNSGTLLGGRNAAYLDAASLNFTAKHGDDMVQQEGHVRDNTQKTAQTGLTTAITDGRVEDNRHTGVTNRNSESEYNARPAANELIASIEGDLRSRDKGVQDAAIARLTHPDTIKTLSAAGITTDDIKKFGASAVDQINKGYAVPNAQQAGLDAEKARITTGIAKGSIDPIIANNPTPEAAHEENNNRTDITAEQKSANRAIIEANKDNWPKQPSQGQVTTESLVRAGGGTVAEPTPLRLDPRTVTDLPLALQRAPAQQVGRGGIMDKYEGGGSYSTLFGHSQREGKAFSGVDVSKMTVAELNEFSKSYGPYVKGELARSGQEARIATPMGRYQIVNSTLQAAAKQMGLAPDTVFTPEVQDKVFGYLMDKRLAGPQTMESKIANLRQEWEGFRKVPDAVLAQTITAYQNGDKQAFTGTLQGGGGNDVGSGNGRIRIASNDPNYVPSPANAQTQSRALAEAAAAPAPAPRTVTDEATQIIADATNKISDQAQALVDTAGVDSKFVPNAAVVEKLANPDAKRDKLDALTIAKELKKEYGEGNEKLDLPHIAKMIKDISNETGLSPDMVGTLMKSNPDGSKSSWNPFSDARYLDVDMKGVRRQAKMILDAKNGKEGDPVHPLNTAVNAIRNSRMTEQTLATAKDLQLQAQNNERSWIQVQNSFNKGALPQEKYEAAKQRYELTNKALKMQLNYLSRESKGADINPMHPEKNSRKLLQNPDSKAARRYDPEIVNRNMTKSERRQADEEDDLRWAGRF